MATNNADDFNNPIAISQGGTNATSMATTDGVVYYDGTRLVTTAVGTSGQVLTSNGSGQAPTWQGGGGGGSGTGWILIQSQSSKGLVTAMNFTTGINNTYNNYKFVISMESGQEVDMVYSTNGGVSYVTSGYASGGTSWNIGSSFTNNFYNTLNAWAILLNNGTSGGPYPGSGNAVIYLFNVTNGQPCTFVGQGTGFLRHEYMYAYLGNSAPINAFQVTTARGLTMYMTVSLYGLNE